jgi:hypothetical protein
LNGIKFGYAGDVIFELLGQDGGELLDGSVSVIHGSRRGVRTDAGRNDVPRRHPFEIHILLCRGHDECPLNVEAEGAFDVLGHPTT